MAADPTELPGHPLVLFSPGKDAGTFDDFTLAIVGSEGTSRGDVTMSEDDMVIQRGVTANPHAIGYLGYVYYQSNKETLQLVSVDNGQAALLPAHKRSSMLRTNRFHDRCSSMSRLLPPPARKSQRSRTSPSPTKASSTSRRPDTCHCHLRHAPSKPLDLRKKSLGRYSVAARSLE